MLVGRENPVEEPTDRVPGVANGQDSLKIVLRVHAFQKYAEGEFAGRGGVPPAMSAVAHFLSHPSSSGTLAETPAPFTTIAPPPPKPPELRDERNDPDLLREMELLVLKPPLRC